MLSTFDIKRVVISILKILAMVNITNIGEYKGNLCIKTGKEM